MGESPQFRPAEPYSVGLQAADLTVELDLEELTRAQAQASCALSCKDAFESPKEEDG